MTLMAVVFAIAADAQYNVGTSSRYTDSYGNSTSTHRTLGGKDTNNSLFPLVMRCLPLGISQFKPLACQIDVCGSGLSDALFGY